MQQEFSLPACSIPNKNQRIYITTQGMNKLLNKHRSKTLNQSAQFAKLFANIIPDNHSVDTSCTASSCTSSNGTTFGTHKQMASRYHVVVHPNITPNPRIHNIIEKPKRIIQMKSRELKKPPTMIADIPQQKQLKPIIPYTHYKDRPYYQIIQQGQQQHILKDKTPEPIVNANGLQPMKQSTSPTVNKTKYKSITKVQRELEKLLHKTQPLQEQVEIHSQSPKIVNPSYMFIEDDRDRNGKYMYPLSSNCMMTPGPGQYEVNSDSLQWRQSKALEKMTNQRLIQMWQQQF